MGQEEDYNLVKIRGLTSEGESCSERMQNAPAQTPAEEQRRLG